MQVGRRLGGREPVSEANDITLVDTSEEYLAALRERLEIRTVCGNGASPPGAARGRRRRCRPAHRGDQSDQTNLCACRIAKALSTCRRGSRAPALDHVDHPELLDDDNFAVDFSICPEQVVTDYIKRLIAFPRRCRYWSSPTAW